jgi:arginine utilization protein RocB
MTRYPNIGVHDKERTEALNQVSAVRQAAVNRVEELLRQRSKVDLEMEFYKKDPTKAPVSLKHRADEYAQSLAAQNRFIGDQDAEHKRVNARFDDELVRLKQLWPLNSPNEPSASRKTR